MKIVTAKEMARIEKLAYSKGASEEAFMNAAGSAIASHIETHLEQGKVTLLCGRGNNAGDAYVAGRLLRKKGYEVVAFSYASFDECSPLCQLQRKRFGKVMEEEPTFDTGIILDGLFGTGFHGEMQEPYRSVIERANRSSLPIFSIDIPSGINGTTGEADFPIHATETLFLGLPKMGCFHAWEHVGRISVHDFGLGKEYIEQAKEEANLICELKLPLIKRTRHKYQAGYVVGVGGSPGMPGAAIMSSYATLRAGAGMVRLLHPAGMEVELSAAPPEIIREGYQDLSTILEAAEKAKALFIGPGFKTDEQSANFLRDLLANLNKPCVIDAGALFLIAEYEIPLPSFSILTPHAGEMKRLLHSGEEPQEYADQNQVIVLLKGAPTTIYHPGKKPFISTRGDPGMATAGSGDVLTGVIAAFLAQTEDPLQATLLGAHFHGLAGEIAAKQLTSYSLIASDIIEALPLAFSLYHEMKW